jgi:hypothetical protein
MDNGLPTAFPKSRYIFPDANILVLLIAGQVSPNLVPQLSPGNYPFDIDDFELLSRLLAQFDATITTPYVLAEVNSLLSKLDNNSMVECRAKLAEYIPLLESRYNEPKDLASSNRFPNFGITDVSILFASEQAFVLTQDGGLIGLLQKERDILDYDTVKQLIAAS